MYAGSKQKPPEGIGGLVAIVSKGENQKRRRRDGRVNGRPEEMGARRQISGCWTAAKLRTLMVDGSLC